MFAWAWPVRATDEIHRATDETQMTQTHRPHGATRVRLGRAAVLAALILVAAAPRAAAQADGLHIGGYAMVGSMSFAATESFDAVLGTSSGTVFGGGATVGLPWGGLFFSVGASRFSAEGERALWLDGQVYPLGIPLTVKVTPVEVTGGWQFRGLSRRFVPYVGGGFSSYAYQESSSFAATGEDVDERFSGYHVLGGAEFKVASWLGVAGEFAWTTVPDALGAGGVSEAFDETDLGGTSLRLKVTIGR